MPGLISSLLVSILLIGFAHGAPTQYASTQTDNCSWWKYVRDDVKCLPEAVTFGMGLVLKLDKNMDKESKWNAMHKACIPLQKCFAATECLSSRFATLKLACDSIVYLKSPGFLECERKMRKSRRDCPIGDKCDIFGKNNCTADMMVEACGNDEWSRFRDMMLVFHRAHPETEKCDFQHSENL